MKNKHFERRREAAKRYKKKRNYGQYPGGVSIVHSYAEPKKLSYWDDFSFVLGSQRVIVTWIHPRMAYIDAIKNEAEANVLAAYGPGPEWNPFDRWIPIWKRVGKSRKKIKLYQMAAGPKEYASYRDKARAEKQRLYRESLFVAKPSIFIEQWETGRHVAITYPAELLNETDIIAFARILKQHLLGRINMFSHLGNYGYTAAEWQAEQVEE